MPGAGERRRKGPFLRLLGKIADRILAAAYEPELMLARLRAEEAGQILRRCRSLGREVSLRMPMVVCDPEQLSFGNQVDVGEFVVLRARFGMSIGDRVLIAAHAVLTTGNHPMELPRWRRSEGAPIVVEDDVWIGAAAVILPGVTIGRGAVVAAGAVVAKSVAPFTVVAGVPAKVIRTLEPEPQADGLNATQ